MNRNQVVASVRKKFKELLSSDKFTKWDSMTNNIDIARKLSAE